MGGFLFIIVFQDVLVEYRKKHRARKVRLLDDTVKTVSLFLYRHCVASLPRDMIQPTDPLFSLSIIIY